MKIILQGELDENQIFECLRNVDFTTESTLTPNPWIKPILPLKESIFEIVSFPSQGCV